jgi:hypothetical protein
MNLLLRNLTACVAAICIAAAGLGPLVTIPPAQVASVALPALA